MIQKVVIFGCATFAEIVHYYLSHDERYEVVAFTVHQSHKKSNEFLELPLVSFEQISEIYPPHTYRMFIAIGYKNLNRTRAEVYFAAKEKGYELITYISPQCIYLGKVIGDNCFIMENNTIQPFVEIGNNVIIWSGNHVGHHSRIGAHCFISSHVVISGGVQVDNYCFIGVNAKLRDGIKIGEGSIIGAGTLIMFSTKPKSVYVAERTKLYPKQSDEIKL